MPHWAFLLLALVLAAAGLRAQTEAPIAVHSNLQVYGGYALLSNCFNGLPGEHQPLNGWTTSFTVPIRGNNLRFKIDISRYLGSNLGASQNSVFVMSGVEYDHRLGRERAFVEGLIGDGAIPKLWGPNQERGETASFVTVLGGGLDTPLSRRFAYRVEAGYQWSNFVLTQQVGLNYPIQTPGLPRYFARVSTGLVWRF